MSVRVTLLLGIFFVAAALAHGGIYSAGHDFVVNRFTGWYQFVPAEDAEDEASRPVGCSAARTLRLDVPGTRG